MAKSFYRIDKVQGLKGLITSTKTIRRFSDSVLESELEGKRYSVLCFDDRYVLSLPCGICAFRSFAMKGKYPGHCISKIISLTKNLRPACRVAFHRRFFNLLNRQP